MPSQLSLHAVTKSYGERIIFDEVSHAIAPGERTGIIGENGSGKSTLLRLLAGREHPDEGRVVVVAEGGLGYLGQDSPLPGHLTVRQVIDNALAELREIEARLRALEPRLAAGDAGDLAEYADLTARFELRGGYDADARVARTLHGLGLAGIDQDRRLDHLSGGEQARLHLAAVLSAGSEVLLLDEPTNHLDDAALTWLAEHLRTRGGTSVVVSHDRIFLEQVATTLVEVDADRRTLHRYGGGYPGYLAEKAAARRRWVEAYERWRTEVERLREVASTSARAVAPGRMMKDRNKVAYDRHGGRVQQSVASRVRNAEQRLRRLLDRPVPPPPQPLRFALPSSLSAASPVASAPSPTAPQMTTAAARPSATTSSARAESASVGPAKSVPTGPTTETPTGHPVAGPLLEAVAVTVADRLHEVSLTVRAGDRLLIDGANGAGKSTLLAVLAGHLSPDGGHVRRRGRCGYLPQDPVVADPRQSLLAAYAHGLPGPPEEHRDRLLGLGLFHRDQVTVPVGALSTGQRQRLALARLLSAPADVLLLDEPTNHLSPGLVEELEAALADFPGALVVVSHDRQLRRRWRGARRTMAAGRLHAGAEVVA